jgi:hypothetical protein
MKGAQTNIARTDSIAPAGFQTLEKRRDLFDAELFDSQLTGITLFPSNELQQEFKAVAVALEGQGA